MFMVFPFSEGVAKIISFLGEVCRVDGAGGPASGGDDAPGVGPAVVIQEHLVVVLEDAAFADVGVGVGHQQDAAFGGVQAAGQRVEAVDDGLELRREAEVVHRRGEGDHVGLHQLLAQSLEVVLDDAGAVHAAGVARAAGADLGLRRVEAEDVVASGLGALDEAGGEGVGVAVFAGAARQDKDLHGCSLRVGVKR